MSDENTLPEEILTQEIPLEEIFVRRDSNKATKVGRYRCVAYVEWPRTCFRILKEADPDFTVRAIDTRVGDQPYYSATPHGQKRIEPPVHFYATREITVCGISRCGTGEDQRSPKAAETDAKKRASFDFGIAHQLKDEQWYKSLGLPGASFYCLWPREYEFEGHVPLSRVLGEEREKFQPGDYAQETGVEKEAQESRESASPEQLKHTALIAVKRKIEQLMITPDDVRTIIRIQFECAESDEITPGEAQELEKLFEGFESAESVGKWIQEQMDLELEPVRDLEEVTS